MDCSDVCLSIAGLWAWWDQKQCSALARPVFSAMSQRHARHLFLGRMPRNAISGVCTQRMFSYLRYASHYFLSAVECKWNCNCILTSKRNWRIYLLFSQGFSSSLLIIMGSTTQLNFLPLFWIRDQQLSELGCFGQSQVVLCLHVLIPAMH